MYLDFAPLEGITGAAFRRVHHELFPGVDRYYTPFLSPTSVHKLTPRNLRELLPEYNRDVPIIPQILTRSPEDFLWAAGELHAMGYEEINLNAGCPSGTVTAKGKGAGLLANPEDLDRFLAQIYDKAPCRISVKTRLGLEDPSEFEELLEVYNRYPIAELIIHPRVRRDFYRHPVRPQWFDWALTRSRNPLSFNGGIVTAEDFEQVRNRYPQLKAIMLGQGLVSDPFLAGRIRCGMTSDRALLQQFHDRLLETYTGQFGSEANAVMRMKELWFYLIRLFDGGEREGKKILKARKPEEYRQAVDRIFRELPLLEQSTGGW